jgi:hypothetical protein
MVEVERLQGTGGLIFNHANGASGVDDENTRSVHLPA